MDALPRLAPLALTIVHQTGEADRERVAELERDAYLRIIAATHGGMPNREFAESVRAWMNTAKHPVTGRRDGFTKGG